jgi:hypothetical protein
MNNIIGGYLLTDNINYMSHSDSIIHIMLSHIKRHIVTSLISFDFATGEVLKSALPFAVIFSRPNRGAKTAAFCLKLGSTASWKIGTTQTLQERPSVSRTVSETSSFSDSRRNSVGERPTE